jgi:SLOG family YspA-like protein
MLVGRVLRKKMLKIIACGSRDWTDKEEILRVLSTLKDNLGIFTVIEGENGERDSILGKAFRGADLIARDAAELMQLPVEPYPANWDKHGRAGGPIRNTQMLVEGKADGLIAFHLNLAQSKGTRNMVNQARDAGLPIWLFKEGIMALFEFIMEMKSIQKRRKDGN